MQRIQTPFRKLFWQLTLSFTAVTVASLLVALLLIGFTVLRQIFLPHNVITPEGWHAILVGNAGNLYQAVLEQDPVDDELISALLNRADAQITHRPFLRIGSFEVIGRTVGEINILILGPNGELLGAHNRGPLERVSIGETFDPSMYPGLSEPLEAAQRGVINPSELISVITPEEEYVLVFPVYSGQSREGNYLGSIVVHLWQLPTVSDIPAHMLALALRGSLLFLVAAGLIGAAFGGLTANRLSRRFERISTAAQAWSQGDFSKFIQDGTGDEISQLSENLDQMAAELRDLVQQRQEMAVMEERNRLARELHDSTKQQALAASFQIGAAQALFDSDPEAARGHLSEAESLVDNVRLELTDLIHELRPASMEGLDLSETLEAYTIEWAHQNDITAEINIQPDQDSALEVRKTLYRVAQESLANVARHSGAARVELSLVYDGGWVTLCVQDDGCGFDPCADYPGMGLESMSERCTALGGSLTINSLPGEGANICSRLPYLDSRSEKK